MPVGSKLGAKEGSPSDLENCLWMWVETLEKGAGELRCPIDAERRHRERKREGIKGRNEKHNEDENE